jgi:hypothetical protein
MVAPPTVSSVKQLRRMWEIVPNVALADFVIGPGAVPHDDAEADAE